MVRVISHRSVRRFSVLTRSRLSLEIEEHPANTRSGCQRVLRVFSERGQKKLRRTFTKEHDSPRHVEADDRVDRAGAVA